MTKQPIPAVVQGTIELESGRVFELDSPRGKEWLAELITDPESGKEKGRSFRYESMRGHASFTARNQPIRGISYWYASKKVGGNLNKIYIGKLEEVSIDRLEEVAEKIAIPKPKKVGEETTGDTNAVVESPDRIQALEAQMAEMRGLLDELRGKLTA
jgi:hypothetical protein